MSLRSDQTVLSSSADQQVESFERAEKTAHASHRGFMGISDIKMNAITLYGNFIILAVIGIVVNPQLVRLLGLEQFGIWKAALRLLDLTAVADGRATQALKWVVARSESETEFEAKQRAVGAAIRVWLIWLPFLLVGLGLILVFVPYLIGGITPSNLPIARIAVAILGVNMMLTALLGLPDAILVGTNQGWRSYLLSTTWLVTANLTMVVVASFGWGLLGVVGATLVCSLLNGVTTYFVVKHHVKWWGISKPSRPELKSMLGFSNLTMLWQLVQVFILTTDVLLIGFISGVETVARYTFFAYVSQFALSICLMTGSAVAPRLGALVGAGERLVAGKMLFQTRQLLLLILTLVGGGMILCNRGFLNIWVGQEYFLGAEANVLMVAVLIQLALFRFDGQIQDLSLQIKSKVLWGSSFSVLSFVLAAIAYWATHSISMMFAGLLLGRLPLNIVFRRLANKTISSDMAMSNAVPVAGVILAIAIGISLSTNLSAVGQFLTAGILWTILCVVVMGPLTLPTDVIRRLRVKFLTRVRKF